MVSTVKSRPNHYETLGLGPTASDDDIACAFARQVKLFRPMAEAARIGIAFETLRNLAKRRDYDAMLGLTPAPAPRAAPTAVAFRISAGFAASAVPPAVAKLASDRSRVPAPPIENRAGSFIAASLRTPVVPDSRPVEPPVTSQAEGRPPPQADVEPFVRPKMRDVPPPGALRLNRIDDSEDRPIAWTRIGAAAGGLVLAVAFAGAWAGTQVGNGEEAQTAKPVASIALPPAAELPDMTAPSRASAPTALSVRPEPPRPGVVIAPVTERALAQQQPARSDPPQGVAGRSVGTGQSDSAVAEISSEQPITEAPRTAASTGAATASLPLPNAVIARTIERIGYSCGKVGSTTAVAGAAGQFTVACTSGQSYQATPVRGRYRFRRVNGQ